MKLKVYILSAFALASGVAIGWIDTRPSWDDTGITAGAICVVTATLGAVMPSRAWLWALLVGGSMLSLNIMLSGNYQAAVALAIAFVGACAGVVIDKARR